MYEESCLLVEVASALWIQCRKMRLSIEPSGHAKEEDVNATFLSAQSNLLDVTASSANETSAPPMMKPATIPASRHQAFVGASSQEQKLDPRAAASRSGTAATEAPPPMMMQPVKPEASLPRKDEESKKEAMRKSIKQPPNSAPAAMIATKKDKSVTGSPQKAPSSDKSKYKLCLCCFHKYRPCSSHYNCLIHSYCAQKASGVSALRKR